MSYETKKERKIIHILYVKLDKKWYDLAKLVRLLDMLDGTGWAGNRVNIGNPHLRAYLEQKKIIHSDLNKGNSWVEDDKKREALYDEMVKLLCGEDDD